MDGPDGLGNALLARLDTRGRVALSGDFEAFDLPVGFKCSEANQPSAYVYFPIRGIVCSYVGDGSPARIDAGLYGRDGFSGVPLVFGLDRSPHEHIVQIAGEAVRAPTPAVVDLMARDTSFRSLLLRFVHCLSLQSSYAALSNTSGDVRCRLARLLVMCDDRIDGHELCLTHSFLATTLGVRRASVTSAMHHLEGEHLIKATRGRVQVQDRRSLAAVAGACYGLAEREYERLIGHMGHAERAPHFVGER